MASKNRNLSAMPTNTNSMKVPVGNTATRGANTAGFIRFNSDLNTLEAANGTVWANVGSGSASSSGGGSSALGGVLPPDGGYGCRRWRVGCAGVTFWLLTQGLSRVAR